MSKETDIKKVASLSPGESCTVFWFDGGGGIVYRINDQLVIYSVPQYGGDESYEATFALSETEQLVDLAHTWT